MGARWWLGLGAVVWAVGCGEVARPPCDTDCEGPAIEATPPEDPPAEPPTAPATCAQALAPVDAAPVDESTWEAAVQEPRYREPVYPGPFLLTEPAACVEDARPAFARWCERRDVDADGIPSRVVRRTVGPVGEWRETFSCHDSPGCQRLMLVEEDDAQGRPLLREERAGAVRRTWTWDAQGRLARYAVQVADGDTRYESERWTLVTGCDGKALRYDVLGGRDGTPMTFTYDTRGLPLSVPGPLESLERAYDVQGRLRMEGRTVAGVGPEERYLDPHGRMVVTRMAWNAGTETAADRWTREDLDPAGRVHTRRSYFHFDHWGSYRSELTRFQRDAQGRPVLAWTVEGYGQGPGGPTGRMAQRWTYACTTGDVVRYEEATDSDSSVGKETTWTWDAHARVLVERHRMGEPAHYERRSEYRFECGG